MSFMFECLLRGSLNHSGKLVRLLLAFNDILDLKSVSFNFYETEDVPNEEMLKQSLGHECTFPDYLKAIGSIAEQRDEEIWSSFELFSRKTKIVFTLGHNIYANTIYLSIPLESILSKQKPLEIEENVVFNLLLTCAKTMCHVLEPICGIGDMFDSCVPDIDELEEKYAGIPYPSTLTYFGPEIFQKLTHNSEIWERSLDGFRDHESLPDGGEFIYIYPGDPSHFPYSPFLNLIDDVRGEIRKQKSHSEN